MRAPNIFTTLPAPGVLPPRLEGRLRKKLDALWLGQSARRSAGKPSSQQITTMYRLNITVVVTSGCTEKVPCRRDLARAVSCPDQWAVSAFMWRGAATRRQCVQAPME